MKKAQWIDLFRGIRKSIGRYLSLLFIVALGTAFFAGVRSAEPDMIASADKYYDESSLMDVRIIGTLGLTEKDVEAIEAVEGIIKAEGGYSMEVLSIFDDEEMVFNVMSAGESINRMTLWEGSMPEKENECFMDQGFMIYKGYEIGDTVTLTDESGNKPENLKTDTFTIVGSGTWSWYLSWSRGSASIGNGSLAAFMVVPEESFDMDYYTEIYAMVNGVKGLSTYSDAYDEAVKLVTDRIEEIAGERCNIRHTEVYEDAEKALSDAREKVTSGEQALADAEKELEDGGKAYEEGKKAYEEGLKEFQSGKSEWEKNSKELAASKIRLQQGQIEYNNGVQALNQAKEALDYGKREVEKQEVQLKESMIQVEKAKEQIAGAEQQIEQAQSQIDAKEREYLAAKSEYDKQAALYEEEASKVRALEAQLSDIRQQISYKQNEIGDLQNQLKQVEQEEGTDSEKYQSIAAQISAKQSELENQQSEAEKLQAQYDAAESELQSAKKELDQAWIPLQSAEQELNAAKNELSVKRQELSAQKEQIAEAERNIENGKQALEEAKKEITENENLIAQNSAQLDVAKNELDAGMKAIEDGEGQLAAAKNQLDEAEEKLNKAQEELLKAREELEKGWKTYKEEAEKNERKLEEAREQIAEGEKQLIELEEGKWYVLGRDTIQNSVEYGMDAERIGAIGNVLPLIFFLVAALVSLTTMTRMIEEERTLIGTMKALGYSKLTIAAKYILYAFSATLIGGVFGVLFGSKVLPYVIMKAYGILYSNVQYIVTPIHWDLCVISILMALVCTVGATIAACYKELLSTPAALMRPPAPKQGKRVFLERIPFIWKNLNFSMKSTIRNLVRYKKRFFMTVIGIGGCMAILLVSFGLKDSVAEIAKNQYKNIWTYSALSGIQEKAVEEQKAELDTVVNNNSNIKSAMLAKLLSVDVFTEKAEKTAQVYVIEDIQKMEEYLDLHGRVTKEKCTLTDDGVILSEKLASVMGVEEGDLVTLKISDTKNAEVLVTGVAENYMNHYVYMTPAGYENIFEEAPKYNQIFFKFEDDVEEKGEQEIAQYLLEKEWIESITLVKDIQKSIDDMMNALNLVVWVLIISAGLLVFVVLFNLNNINISERRRELASLKVLGFSDIEVAIYVYRENIFLTLFGICIGVVMGSWLHKYLILTLEVDMIMFGRQINPMSYVYSIILTVLFAMLVNISMFYKLRQIDMVESLKSVE